MTSILIVEDDITYGMMLKTWLGKKGFQVTSASSIALTRASQRGAGSILRLFDRHAFSGGNPLHLFSNVLPHRRRGQDRPARGIPLCGYSL